MPLNRPRRINNMTEYIYNNQKKSIDPTLTSEFYTIIGSQEFLDASANPRVRTEEDVRVLAKKIIREDGSKKYAIKTNASGKFQNPVSIYGEEHPNNFLDRICRSSDKFKEVNLKVFDLYVHFLQTKNIAWLNNAEREAQ